MRTILFLALLLTSIILNAQDTIINNPDSNILDDEYYIYTTTVMVDSTMPNGCNANFSYALNIEIMTFSSFAPATAFDFYDHSEGDIISWFWDFGDGNYSYEQNPTHLFNLPVFPDGAMVKLNPYRTVTLTILTSDSCRSFYSETIDIYNRPVDPDPRCKAAFKHYTLSYDSIGGTETFQFSNRSEGESLSYLWLFDDGSTSTEIEPSKTYDFSQPMHKVSLTITSSNGCTDTYGEDVFMDYSDDGSTEPGDSTYNGCFVAFGYTINYTINTFAPALALDFYTKSEADIVSWFWDFGDGYTSDLPNPTHIFAYPIPEDSVLVDPNSLRTICLTITSASGCQSTWCQTIDIYTGKEPYVKYCHPWFKGYIPTDIMTIPEVIPFQFTEGSEGDVVSWFWQFEDGTTSTDREPLVMFDAFKLTQEVCLTITTSDSCKSTWCETIYVTPEVVDTFVYVEPVCNYTFNYTSFFPEWASACIGTATAQVVFNDSAISTQYYYWTNGNGEFISESQEVKNLCPTQTYTVTALTTDGCKFSGSFIFNSDGTVTEIPVNWWIYRAGDDSYISYNRNNEEYIAEWVLCDGTIVTGDSIPLDKINCGSSEANFIVKDAAGNTIYSEKIALNTDIVSNNVINSSPAIEIYPVPVIDKLNINYKNKPVESLRFEISDLSGRTIIMQNFQQVKTGQQLHVDVTSLQNGIYIGKIISDNHIITVKKFSK